MILEFNSYRAFDQLIHNPGCLKDEISLEVRQFFYRLTHIPQVALVEQDFDPVRPTNKIPYSC